MPLFGNKFSPKKPGLRKSPSLSNLNLDASERTTEFGVDYGPIRINLGGSEITFDDGQWISEAGGGAANHKEVIRLRKQSQQLVEENNLLKLKVELLLDMLAETTAEVHLQENEIEQLKRTKKK